MARQKRVSEAEVHVPNPRSMVEDWENGFFTADVIIGIAQDPNFIVIRGTRTEVTKCLVQDLNISPDEVGDFFTTRQ